MKNPTKKLIIIFGPTSSGKTDLSLRLAKYIYGKHRKESELISADSRQVYKDMNIGTSKVSREVRRQHLHHMIDILEPTQGYSSKDFAFDASAIMTKAWAHGKLPILVGGTGTFVMGIVGDRYLFETRKGNSLGFETLMLVPYFERERLYRKIEWAIDRMFIDGLYGEVLQIIDKYHEIPLQIKKTHGYREFIEYAARGGKDITNLNKTDLERIKSKIKADTKKYAMHQAGWFKKMHGHHVVANLEEAKALVDAFIMES
jgi:tRNA A37 N6-isopentenylltransferase MiaA